MTIIIFPCQTSLKFDANSTDPQVTYIHTYMYIQYKIANDIRHRVINDCNMTLDMSVVASVPQRPSAVLFYNAHTCASPGAPSSFPSLEHFGLVFT